MARCHRRSRSCHPRGGGPDGTLEVAIQDIVGVRSEVLVGGHRLELERNVEPAICLLYSRSLGEKFAEVSRGIEQLRKGRRLRINAEPDSIRCEKCIRLLPVRGGICPACTSRAATLCRVAGDLKPYWPSGLLLAVASILNSGSELLPPLITRALVDDILVPVATDGGDPEARLRLLGTLVLGLVAIHTGLQSSCAHPRSFQSSREVRTASLTSLSFIP